MCECGFNVIFLPTGFTGKTYCLCIGEVELPILKLQALTLVTKITSLGVQEEVMQT